MKADDQLRLETREQRAPADTGALFLPRLLPAAGWKEVAAAGSASTTDWAIDILPVFSLLAWWLLHKAGTAVSANCCTP